MRELRYDRSKVAAYAKKWALSRNPAYLDFEELGGDCTNFASQCIYAGSNVMNPTKIYGWYYYSSNDRSASWAGVKYLYEFLVNNKGVGPYAVLSSVHQLEIGDIIQLGKADGTFYHSPVVVGITADEIYVAAHSYDAYMRPLSTYKYDIIRYLHIVGVRNW